MINNIPTIGTADASRSILVLGGTELDFIDWEIEQNGVMDAGTFRATISAPMGWWPFWSQQTESLIDVYAGTPKDPLNYTVDDLTQIMTARCDSIELDPETNRVTVSGRDMTSLLIEQKISEKWVNSTSSQIVKHIADLWGFDSIITKTTGLVGKYSAPDYVLLAKSDTYWNILTYLAQQEKMQCFVLGRTLHFGNFGAKSSNDPYLIQFDGSNNIPIANASRLRFSRDMTLAQDISVTVKSYHGGMGAAFSGTATAIKSEKNVERLASIAMSQHNYDFNIPGLTKPECEEKAKTILEELSKHELKMSATLPFDVILFPWVPIEVTGTNTPWDTIYSPQSISRRFSKDRVSMTVTARAGAPLLLPVSLT